MKRFAQLFTELDRTNRTNEKVAALESYFREADPRDAAWALQFLCGRRPPRAVSSTALREWAAEEAGLPEWLVEECREAVGDMGETVALILPAAASTLALPLHQLVEQRLLPMRHMALHEKKKMLLLTWRELDTTGRFLSNKLITGGFRVGVAQTLVARALASVAGVEPAVMAHRLAGHWQPTVRDFQRLLDGSGASETEPARPYPFFLASQLDEDPATLGPPGEWQAEWKWDGIRAQIIRRAGEIVVWSRGDEMVTAAFPEIAAAAHMLPDGTVLDGEILAWENGRPLPFARLQRRLGRKVAGEKIRAQHPVAFLAYDLLEWNGEDWRSRPLEERRAQLEAAVRDAVEKWSLAPRSREPANETLDLFPGHFAAAPREPVLQLSEIIRHASWEDLAALRLESRARQTEGVMLKRRHSPYRTGRPRGDWWKWKIDPLVIDAVLMNAQAGNGRRASLYTDYTFGVWDGEKLVPVAKAYSGLSDEEILAVDKFIRANTTGKFGPIRAVKPELVFELAFEGVQESSRHKTGVAVRFPRIHRWRHDKKPGEADTLENLKALLR